MRLFAALWPTDAVRDHLASTLRSAVGVDPVDAPGRASDGVRWTAAECWHITLAFYGEVGDGRVEELTDDLAELATEVDPFTLHLRGAGVFAHRTLWTGVGGDLESVHRLVEGCRQAAEHVGLHTDHRVRSRAHLTLGRAAGAGHGPGRGRSRDRRRPGGPGREAPADHAVVHALSVYQGPDWPVRELVLASSEPGAGRAGGPLYTAIARWPLGVTG